MLSGEQQKDLEKAILEYLANHNYSAAAKALKDESKVLKASEEETTNENILERKWLTIIRLQAKIVELERKQAETEEILSKSVRSLKVPENSDGKTSDSKHEIKNPVLKLSKTYKGHKEPINAVAIHLSEPVFASASSDSTIRIYDYELQNQVSLLKGHTHSVNCVAWDKENLFSGSSDMTIKMWSSSNKTNLNDFAEFHCVKTLIGHEHSVSYILNLIDIDQIVSCSRDKSIRLWDKATGYCKRTISGVFDDWVRTIDNNEKHLVASGNDKKLFVFDLQKLIQTEGKESSNPVACVVNIFEVHENYVESVKVLKKSTFMDDSQVAFTASRDKSICAWNYLKGSCLATFKGHENWIKDLSLIEEYGFLVSVGEDKSIRLWDLKKKKTIYLERNAHEHFIASVDYHKEFRVLVTGSVDKTSKVWKLMNSTSQDIIQSLI